MIKCDKANNGCKPSVSLRGLDCDLLKKLYNSPNILVDDLEIKESGLNEGKQ